MHRTPAGTSNRRSSIRCCDWSDRAARCAPPCREESASRDERRCGAWIRGWGEAIGCRRIGGLADARQGASGCTGALRLADCNQLPRVSWVLLAAGLLVSGLCVLCVLCGSFLLLLLLLLLQKQNNHREHREHRAEQSRAEESRAEQSGAGPTEVRQQHERPLRCAPGGVACRAQAPGPPPRAPSLQRLQERHQRRPVRRAEVELAHLGVEVRVRFAAARVERDDVGERALRTVVHVRRREP
jgi:hypothetical protein